MGRYLQLMAFYCAPIDSSSFILTVVLGVVVSVESLTCHSIHSPNTTNVEANHSTIDNSSIISHSQHHGRNYNRKPKVHWYSHIRQTHVTQRSADESKHILPYAKTLVQSNELAVWPYIDDLLFLLSCLFSFFPYLFSSSVLYGWVSIAVDSLGPRIWRKAIHTSYLTYIPSWWYWDFSYFRLKPFSSFEWCRWSITKQRSTILYAICWVWFVLRLVSQPPSSIIIVSNMILVSVRITPTWFLFTLGLVSRPSDVSLSNFWRAFLAIVGRS